MINYFPFFFSSSLVDGPSVFESTGSTDADTLFNESLGRVADHHYRGRLPGRLSSSSLGGPAENIRSVTSVFPRPNLSSFPQDGRAHTN